MWERRIFNSGFEWQGDGYEITLGSFNHLGTTGYHFTYHNVTEAKVGILAFALRLRGVADEIEQALAEAPKEV